MAYKNQVPNLSRHSEAFHPKKNKHVKAVESPRVFGCYSPFIKGARGIWQLAPLLLERGWGEVAFGCLPAYGRLAPRAAGGGWTAFVLFLFYREQVNNVICNKS
jgi:hypothetical protein